MGTAAPTGKPLELTSTVIYRVAVGRIVGEWPCRNRLRVVQQFGAEVRLPGHTDRPSPGETSE